MRWRSRLLVAPALAVALVITAFLFLGQVSGRYPPQSPYQCRNLALSDFKGVNFIDATLTDTQNGGPILRGPVPSVLDRLQTIKANGFNVVRVPMHWESYAKDRRAFLDNLAAVASAAQNAGLCIFFDNQQWMTSSWFTYDNVTGSGFPPYLLERYNNSEAGKEAFWADYYNNSDTVEGLDIWTWQSHYLNDVVITVDKYSSVLGYEVLNEPKIYDRSQYAKLGNLQTFVTSQMRMHTSKTIFFCKTELNLEEPSNYVQIDYDSLTKPRVDNTVFDAHQYNTNFPEFVSQYQALANSMKVPLLMGEWGVTSQSQATTYISEFRARNLGWLVWVWDPIDSRYSLNDYNYSGSDRMDWLLKSKKAIYGN